MKTCLEYKIIVIIIIMASANKLVSLSRTRLLSGPEILRIFTLDFHLVHYSDVKTILFHKLYPLTCLSFTTFTSPIPEIIYHSRLILPTPLTRGSLT